MTTTPLADLKARLREITNIEQALMLLAWDQETYMPPGGNAARGRQMATLGRIAQEKMIDPEMGRLLEKVESEADALPWESDDAALIRQARRNYDRLTKIPPELTSRLVAHFADSYHAWTKARLGSRSSSSCMCSMVPQLRTWAIREALMPSTSNRLK